MTVISCLQSKTVKGASIHQGHALSIADNRKFSAHGAACSDVGVTFIPLAVETLGGWSEEACYNLDVC